MGKATQNLRKEHEEILNVLHILERMIRSDRSDAETLLRYCGEMVYFFKVFADQCHHGKEENILFKELIDKGIPNEYGPVGVMLNEHALGREYTAQMSHSCDESNIEGFKDAAIRYSDLLRQHIEKEDNVLFMMADSVINEQEQELLFKRFVQHEENVTGHGINEKLHAMVDVWFKTFGVE